MSLPSREQVRTANHVNSLTDYLASVTPVLIAYADGDLMTRQEAIDAWKDDVRETGEFDICLEADNGDCLVMVDHICSLAWDQSKRMTRQGFIDSIEVNVGMIRAARDAQNEADRAVLDTDESDYTWWHIVLSAAISALGETT